ncbi:hypothetical protein PHET_06192 [Paragonimus heterotremus]|uniref:Uncharacterized protein n=1 Tax=Paragonimus heterotremus TaxID=100268 RepID=A0A8J4WHV5_9TREM|nr:hypothetical protein PHET_06192 [Paragonimus heterotremus]
MELLQIFSILLLFSQTVFGFLSFASKVVHDRSRLLKSNLSKSQSETSARSDYKNNGTAKLKISWSFENPTLRSEHGLSCQPKFTRGCPVRFELCLQHGFSEYIKLCKLFHYTTRVYKKVITLEESVTVSLQQPLPKLFTFEITAISTVYNENNKIGTFLASRFKLPTNGETKSLRMSRIAHGYLNSGLR